MSRIRDSIRKVRKASKRPNKTQKDPTIDRKVIPLMERERIAQMHMLGKNKSKIAAETGHTRKSIAKIISEANIPQFVEKVRGRFIGLGELAVETLENEMRAGNWELAYRFLKDSGILADIEGRAFALNVATGNPTSQVALTPESRDLLLNSLSESDKRVFRVLELFRRKREAYGMGDDIMPPAFNVESTAAPAEQEPNVKKGA